MLEKITQVGSIQAIQIHLLNHNSSWFETVSVSKKSTLYLSNSTSFLKSYLPFLPVPSSHQMTRLFLWEKKESIRQEVIQHPASSPTPLTMTVPISGPLGSHHTETKVFSSFGGEQLILLLCILSPLAFSKYCFYKASVLSGIFYLFFSADSLLAVFKYSFLSTTLEEHVLSQVQ